MSIEIYTLSYCPYCAAAKRFFDEKIENSLSIEEIDFPALNEYVKKNLLTQVRDSLLFKDKWGSPHLALHESKIQKWNIHKISVSMSHDNDMALAICVIL